MQILLGRTQRAVFHVIEAAQGAAETLLIEWKGGLGEDQRQFLLTRDVLADLQLPSRDPGHQRLTIGQRDIKGAVRRFLNTNASVLAQILDQILAVVTQGRGVAPGRLHLANLSIELGNVAGQPVDLADHSPTLALQRVELGADVAVEPVETLRQLLGLADDLLAQRDGFWGRAGFAERSEEVIQADADAGAFTIDQTLQRGQVLLIGTEVLLVGRRAPQLLVLEVVGQPANAADLNATTDTGRGLPAERMQLRRQTAEAGRVDVGDVLPGRRQGDLRGANAAVANLTKNTHDTISFDSTRIG